MSDIHHFHLKPRLIMCVAVPLLLCAFMAWTGAALTFICDTLSGLMEVVFNQVCNISW